MSVEGKTVALGAKVWFTQWRWTSEVFSKLIDSVISFQCAECRTHPAPPLLHFIAQPALIQINK